MSNGKIKVLYIAGTGRSGSTLLDRMLGQIDGFWGCGELDGIWTHGLAENRLCGCGRPFKQCDFWGSVLEDVFGSGENAQRVSGRLRSFFLRRYIPMLLWPQLRTPRYQSWLDEYSGILKKMYQAIQKISSCRVVVDSSKWQISPWMTRRMPEFDLYVLHLVRDSRAVAYSWQRPKVTLRLNPLRAAMDWGFSNLLAQALKTAGDNYLLVRYEDFVRQPQSVIEAIVRYVQEPPSDLSFFVDSHTVRLALSHNPAGNPNKHDQGMIEIRPDLEWQMKMPRFHQYLVTTLTWPLLLKYDYFGKSASG